MPGIANAASWQAAASSYASFVTAASQQKQQLADIDQLVTGRFPWSLLLSQIGGVMPANAALSSLQASSPSCGRRHGGSGCDVDDPGGAGDPDLRLRRERIRGRGHHGGTRPGPRCRLGLAVLDV